VVESTGFEIRHTGNRIEGSNPSFSARLALILFINLREIHIRPTVRPNSKSRFGRTLANFFTLAEFNKNLPWSGRQALDRYREIGEC
jgi:hypothetical protein